jgi:hypothetical protein
LAARLSNAHRNFVDLPGQFEYEGESAEALPSVAVTESTERELIVSQWTARIYEDLLKSILQRGLKIGLSTERKTK